jgi:hypothetical protein
VDLGHHTLQVGQEEVLLWSPWAILWLSCLVARDQVVLAQCEGVLIARLESPLGAEDGLIGTSPEALAHEVIFIAKTLAWDQQEVPSEY